MSELDGVAAHRNPPRPCGCGCGGIMVNPHARRQYLDGHRDRVYRRKLTRAAEDAGIETRLSLKRVRATNASSERRADAKASPPRRKRAPRPGVSVYLPRPELADAVLDILAAHGTPLKRSAPAEVEELQRAVVKARDRARAKRGD